MQPKEDAAYDMMTLYGLVSSLSPGQRAGLVNISLQDLIGIAMSDPSLYSEENIKDLVPASIYEGVDRQIYEKGGVALTSEALRQKASAYDTEYNPLSKLTRVMLGISTASFVVTAGLWMTTGTLSHMSNSAMDQIKSMFNEGTMEFQEITRVGVSKENLLKEMAEMYEDGVVDQDVINAKDLFDRSQSLASKSSVAMGLAIGMTVLTVAITAYTVYMTYNELMDYYDVEFSPIPNYMVDEADITRKKENGETYVIKNQTAYYKAVLCNRTESDEKYSEIGDKADLNGDVGRKWVALYSVKNAAQYPILADSFKVVTGSSNVPLDYSNGIHKFGSGAAFDMNNTYYAWNHGKGGIYV